ncbi:MAG: hypothetical protein OEM91_05295, partial [Hyphomicrobiales bacterium]|nr:hypothetical protein [Hyphomicrobiales bacterium]
MQNASALLNQFLGQPDNTAPPPANQPQQGAGGMNLKSFVNGPGGLATGALAGGVAGLLLGGKKPKKTGGIGPQDWRLRTGG